MCNRLYCSQFIVSIFFFLIKIWCCIAVWFHLPSLLLFLCKKDTMYFFICSNLQAKLAVDLIKNLLCFMHFDLNLLPSAIRDRMRHDLCKLRCVWWCWSFCHTPGVNLSYILWDDILQIHHTCSSYYVLFVGCWQAHNFTLEHKYCELILQEWLTKSHILLPEVLCKTCILKHSQNLFVGGILQIYSSFSFKLES